MEDGLGAAAEAEGLEDAAGAFWQADGGAVEGDTEESHDGLAMVFLIKVGGDGREGRGLASSSRCLRRGFVVCSLLVRLGMGDGLFLLRN